MVQCFYSAKDHLGTSVCTLGDTKQYSQIQFAFESGKLFIFILEISSIFHHKQRGMVAEKKTSSCFDLVFFPRCLCSLCMLTSLNKHSAIKMATLKEVSGNYHASFSSSSSSLWSKLLLFWCS